MTIHDYMYDTNRIISLANRNNLGLVENYALNLDNMLSTDANVPEQFIENTIEFLYGLLEDVLIEG